MVVANSAHRSHPPTTLRDFTWLAASPHWLSCLWTCVATRRYQPASDKMMKNERLATGTSMAVAAIIIIGGFDGYVPK